MTTHASTIVAGVDFGTLSVRVGPTTERSSGAGVSCGWKYSRYLVVARTR